MNLKYIAKKMASDWLQELSSEFDKEYMIGLNQFLDSELKNGKTIFPEMMNIFSAFELTPLNQVKVVIIGQDPYHGDGQAHGLSFSVLPNIQPPPSLKNIYKELENDLNIPHAKHGHLIKWAQQGVLMINSVLTVEKGKAGSHHNRGWEQFTDKVIQLINDKKQGVIFLLWGNSAQRKAKRIDPQRHYLLKTAHPSPLSAFRGFFGSKQFSKTNEILLKNNLIPIDWSID